MKEKVAELLGLFEEKCTPENRIFKTLWVNDQRAWVWLIDEDTLFIRFNQYSTDGQKVFMIGVLREKEAVRHLKALHQKALKDLLITKDGRKFDQRMVNAVQEVFVYVDEHVIVRGNAQDDMKIFFLPADARRDNLITCALA
jgi:hypothetical protein